MNDGPTLTLRLETDPVALAQVAGHLSTLGLVPSRLAMKRLADETTVLQISLGGADQRSQQLLHGKLSRLVQLIEMKQDNRLAGMDVGVHSARVA